MQQIAKLYLTLLVLYSRFFYRLRVDGAEHIPRTGPCILTMNYHGYVGDRLALAVIRHRREPGSLVGFVGRELCEEAWRTPFLELGRLNHLAGDGTEPLAAYKARGLTAPELLRALAYLREERALFLAAEGEVSWDGRLKPLKPGAAWMALRANAPVIPVVSTGGYDVLPRWARWPRLTGKISVRVGQPFYLHDQSCVHVSDEMIQAGSERIRAAMAALLRE